MADGQVQTDGSAEVEQNGAEQVVASVEVRFKPTTPVLPGFGGIGFVTRTPARSSRVLSRIRRRP